MSKQAAKKRKIVYRDTQDAKAAELEEFLFGAKGDAGSVFDKRADSDDDDLTLTELMNTGQLFFEDKAGQEAPTFDLTSSEDESDSEGGDEQQQSDDESADEGSQQQGEADLQNDAAEQQGHANGIEGDQSDMSDEEQQDMQHSQKQSQAAAGGRKVPVWEDPADKQLSVNIADKARLRKLRKAHNQNTVDGSAYVAALRRQHASLNPNTSWASKETSQKATADSDAEDDADNDDEEQDITGLLTQAGGLLSRPARLPPGLIETTRLKDANIADPSKAVVQSLGWHPSGQLFMTAGLDKKVRLFQVDGADNPLLQGVYLQDCPIQQASWACGGTQIVAAGRRPFFYVYDLASSTVERVQPSMGACQLKSLETFAVTSNCSDGPGGYMLAFCGDQGYIPLISLKSRQWVANLKMNGSVRCAVWAPGGEQLLTLGGDGIVNTWDMRMRRCLSQMRDYANVHPTALAISPNGQYVATGSESGVVNIYDRNTTTNEVAVSNTRKLGGGVDNRKPLKEVMNLTTTIDSLTFSHDSQMLAFASRMKKDSMRLLHLPSCTVFSNWPTTRSPLHYVHSLAFSPHSGFLTIGNARGRALLYRLHHYQEA